MVRLAELHLELLAHVFVHLVMIIELVKVVHKLLVVLNSEVCLHLLHVFDFFLVATHLFLHFLKYLVRRGIALLHVIVTAEELLGLRLHVLEQGRLLLRFPLALLRSQLV